MVVAFSFPFKHSIFEAAILSPQLPFSAGNQKNYPGTVLYSTGIVEIMQSIYEIMKKVIIVK